MWNEQSLRLLRESWPNPGMLAEELYAIFNSTSQVQHSGSFQVSATNSGNPPLTVKAFDQSGLGLRLQGQDGSTADIKIVNGVLDLGSFVGNNVGESQVVAPPPAAPPQFQFFPVIITTNLGSGIYVVDFYANGLSNPKTYSGNAQELNLRADLNVGRVYMTFVLANSVYILGPSPSPIPTPPPPPPPPPSPP